MGTGKSLKRAKKNSDEEKSRTRRRALLRVLDFSSSEFFFARFRLFPVSTNCPWVSEDGRGLARGNGGPGEMFARLLVLRKKQKQHSSHGKDPADVEGLRWCATRYSK